MENNKFIERFAEVQGITYEEAEQAVGAPTDEEILKNIEKVTLAAINEKNNIKLNREQRRALKKKLGAKKFAELYSENDNPVEVIADTTRKLEYIDLIQKLRELNEKNAKEIEENEAAN